LVRRFDGFIATSAEIERELLETGIAASRIRRLPNGVDHRKFQPVADAAERDALRKQLRLPPGPIVCFVGIIDARKNVDGALRIFQRARSTAGCGHFVLIGPQPLTESGEPTAYARELSEFVAENGLADHVSFTGQRTEVAEYLRAANVFLFPSRREGMPNVVLEAMASGLPCVASRIGGAVDLIEDGTTGFLHDVDNEADFAESLAALLTDAGLAARCGAAARAHVEANLSLEQLAERYAALYAELVAPTGSGKRA
jgi:glycosyltransferase involved in cell wall biosynthesis